VADRLVQLKPWAESSDRELMVKGRHSRRFYELADRLLRDEVALSRLHGDIGNHAQTVDLEKRIQSARQAMMSSFAEVEA
jgi:hypothetical protein